LRPGARRWNEFFQFTGQDDFGFARYPFPGKAHTDYWDDEGVFGHFIQTVIKPEGIPGQPPPPRPKTIFKAPGNNWCSYILSPLVPYVLAFALCFLGVYLLYKGVAEFIGSHTTPLAVLRNVTGLTTLLASLTVAARIPRLTLLWRWWFVGWFVLLCCAFLYLFLVAPEARGELGSWVGLLGFHEKERAMSVTGASAVGLMAAPFGHGSWLVASALAFGKAQVTQATLGVLLLAAVLALLVPPFSSRSAYWGGTKLLIIAGGIVIALLVWHLIAAHSNHDGHLWPMLLASAAFLYLWWLSALLFDLAFVWHRYIRHSVIEDRLRQLVPSPEQKAGDEARPPNA
jgi:hypothetical protein